MRAPCPQALTGRHGDWAPTFGFRASNDEPENEQAKQELIVSRIKGFYLADAEPRKTFAKDMELEEIQHRSMAEAVRRALFSMRFPEVRPASGSSPATCHFRGLETLQTQAMPQDPMQSTR